MREYPWQENSMIEEFNAFEAIKERISVRSYSSQPVENALRRELEDYIETVGTGPFGITPRFKMLDLEPLDKNELRGLGTYGFIKGAHLYILGAVKDAPGAMEDLGYCLEKIILKATSLGLGTCWLGGTFKRAAFAQKMDLEAGELLPAITPVGHPADEATPADRLARLTAKSKKRKPWPELFFGPGGKAPLTEKEAGVYRDSLEAVRLGPSASNRQPWRIIKDEAGKLHLFLKENKLYNRILGKIRLQRLDMGIAMCHFTMVAREQNLPGSWKLDDGAPALTGLQYIATWSD
ncbi:MAG: nitroreductase family protein [Bacillota bacterium]